MNSIGKKVYESCGVDASKQSSSNSTAVKQTSYSKPRHFFLLSKMLPSYSSRAFKVFVEHT